MLNLFLSGGLVMWPLLLCSVLTVAIVLHKYFFWCELDKNLNTDLILQVLQLANLGQYEEARGLGLQNKTSVIVKILLSGLAPREYSLGRALEMAAGDELKKIRANLPVLETIITVAPFLGILGTILGIIHTFELLGGSTQMVEPAKIMAGVAEALVASAFGLLIAVVATVGSNYFQHKTEGLVQEIEKYGTSLEICFEKHQNS
jgi:biopolymer transport protein ExbB